jgi:DUF2934 family protein
MSTVPTEVLRKAPRAKDARPANAIDRSTIRAITEAAEVGCGQILRRAMIAEAAYYLAERRGFEPGHELEDWVAAEGEIQHLWTRALEEAPIHCGD